MHAQSSETPGHPPERLTFAYFLRELQHYLHLEKGLPHTLVDLLRRPGPTLRGYFDGTGRAGYSSPVAYSLIASAVSLIVFGLYREAFVDAMRARMAGAAATMPKDAVPWMTEFVRAYGENIFQVTQHTALTSMGQAVPQALALWLLFRSPRFNVAEAFAFALYAIGTFLYLHAVLVAPIVYFTHAWDFAQHAGFGLQLLVALWLGIGLFGARIGTLVRLGLAFVASLLAWLIALVVGVGVYTAVVG